MNIIKNSIIDEVHANAQYINHYELCCISYQSVTHQTLHNIHHLTVVESNFFSTRKKSTNYLKL